MFLQKLNTRVKSKSSIAILIASEMLSCLFKCPPGGQDTDNFDTDGTPTRQNNYYGYGIVDAWEALKAIG